MCDKYREQVEDILRKSDLSTITTKEVRHTLQEQLGTSLDPIRKDVNALIKRIFIEFESAEALKEEKRSAERQKVLHPSPASQKVLKSTTPNTIKKKEVKKKKDVTEKKPINWPILKVSPPLSIIIGTDICTRPLTVKKLWDYIKRNKLQNEKDKRMIDCDNLMKQLCGGESIISSFAMNKYLKEFLISVPKEEQAAYRKILNEREGIQS
ncbi:SWIB/MDM2 domain-containing protein [Blakeslea trispora]|nr:SWIB/MDM2 domain-containing protein [Blakeslea trispora]